MITNHARKRQQQRGIPSLIVEWLLGFGRELHDGRGGILFFFDKKARRQLERCVGRAPVRRMSDYLDTYAVVNTRGTLITVGHRHGRFRR